MNRPAIWESGAAIDPTGTYRYRLWRHWGPADQPRLAFVMLNPSTADADKDDPTIRRCIGFARTYGYGGIEVLNLYAYRATRPCTLVEALEAGVDLEGPGNVATWLAVLGAPNTPTVVAAWGSAVATLRLPPSRALTTCAGDRFWWVCLGRTKDGHPRHPLYIRGDAMAEHWEAEP